MAVVMENLEEILALLVEVSVLLFEYIGVILILYAGIRGIIDLVKRDKMTRLHLGETMSLALGFMMASEILNSVIAPSLAQIAVIGGIIALRASLTVLLHWEMTNEKKELEEEHEKH